MTQKSALLRIAALALMIAPAATWAQEANDAARAAIEAKDLRRATVLLKDRLQQAPTDHGARILLAEIHLRRGAGADAEKELSQAVAAGADEGPLAPGFAEALLLQGRNQEALDRLQSIASNGDQSARIQALTGRAWFALGEVDDARAAFRAAVRLDQGNEAAALGLLIIANSEDPSESVARTDAFLERFPDNLEGLLARAHLYVKAGEMEQAASAFTRALVQAPADLPALGGRAVARIALGRYDLARQDLAAIAAIDRAALLPGYLRAVIALKTGNPAQARGDIEAVLAANPDHNQSRYLMGVIALKLGDLELAVHHLSQLNRRFPHSINAAKALATAYLALGEPARAVPVLNPFTGADDAGLFQLLGVAQLRLGNQASGIEWLQRAVDSEPSAQGFRPRLALSLMEKGDTEAAVQQLKSEIDLSPQGPEAEVLLTLTQIRAKEFSAAAEGAAALIERLPKDPIGYNLAGLVKLAQGDSKGAADAFGDALEVDPTFAVARLNLARTALSEQDPDLAKAELARLLEQDPRNLDAMLGLAEIAVIDGDAATQERWLTRAFESHPETWVPGLRLVRLYLADGRDHQAQSAVIALTERFPDQAEPALERARVLGALGDREGAVEALDRLRARGSDSPAVALALGQGFLENGATDRAQEAFEAILARAPTSAAAKVGLATALWKNSDPAGALAIGADLQRQLPDSPIGYRIEGDIYFAAGDYQRSAPALREAFERQRSGPLARALAESLYRTGALPDAVATLAAWLKDDPKDVNARAMLALYHQESGHPDKALALYADMDFGDPADPLAMNNVAWMLFERGDPRALDLARRAFERLPSRPEIADTAGWILFKSGHAEEGMRILQQSWYAYPADPDIAYHLALAYHESGRTDEAAQILKDMLARAPTAANAAKANALLETLKP